MRFYRYEKTLPYRYFRHDVDKIGYYPYTQSENDEFAAKLYFRAERSAPGVLAYRSGIFRQIPYAYDFQNEGKQRIRQSAFVDNALKCDDDRAERIDEHDKHNDARGYRGKSGKLRL